MDKNIRIRPLEKEDLAYIHLLHTNEQIMMNWFEEPYKSYSQLRDQYHEQIYDDSRRRFIVEYSGAKIGIVELVYIDYIHRKAEFQIIIDPENQGKGYATTATQLALQYGFSTLNLHKIYLFVDKRNEKATHVYKKVGFQLEVELKDEFFVGGRYCDALRMSLFQQQFHSGNTNKNTPTT